MAGGGLHPDIRVEGLRTLRASLKAAGLSVQDLKDAHREVADIVVRSSAPWAPRRTGALAASVRGAGQQGAAVVRAGRSAVPYANPIHWGWPSRHIKAQPWLWIAGKKSQDQWTAAYLHALEKIIDSIEGAPGP